MMTVPQALYTINKYKSNPKISRKTCFLRYYLLLGILSLLVGLPCSAFSQSPDPLLQKLDSHYYYPSQLGLKKLTAKVQWLQKDLRAAEPKFVSHPEVLFSWDAQSDARLFQVDPRLKGLTQTQKKEIENLFQNYREVVLPRSLSQTLYGFKSNQADKAFFKTTVEYPSPYKHDEIQTYSLDINAEQWKISKINIARRTPPHNVVSEFKYIQREGKWLASEILARFDLGRDSYSEKTSYLYQKIMGFWLPVKIDQVFKKGSYVVHSYRFLLSDFQIN